MISNGVYTQVFALDRLQMQSFFQRLFPKAKNNF